MKFKLKTKLTGFSGNKEGGEDQGLPCGMTLKLTAVVGTKVVKELFSTIGSGDNEEMFVGTSSKKALEQSFWDKNGAPRYFGIKEIKLDKELEHMMITIDQDKELVSSNTVLKGFSVVPTNEQGYWNISFSCYIRDPSDYLLAHCFHSLKDSILFEAEEIDIPMPTSANTGEV